MTVESFHIQLVMPDLQKKNGRRFKKIRFFLRIAIFIFFTHIFNTYAIHHSKRLACEYIRIKLKNRGPGATEPHKSNMTRFNIIFLTQF